MSLTRIGLTIVAIAAAIVTVYALFQAFDDRAAPPIVIEDATADQPVVIDVRGAVNTPGVFTLPSGARVQDAVSAAGGLSSSAELSTINLARRVRDGEALVIQEIVAPGTLPAPQPSNQPIANAGQLMQRINLNTADVSELEVLPGIGAITAERIVLFREENGPYRSVDDVIHVQGISDRMVDQFREMVTVGP
ncbi:MAG: helix-hairpin-helix domain-containing protein [Chloroflexota bacterium]|nr:helix-hairpin-helix domain-containing protein [Chloroflexota bacterium]